MKIIYKDEYIAVCQKEAGELSEGSGKNCLPTLLSEELYTMGEKNTDIFPVHRLDRETVGVTVFARTPSAAAALSESIRDGTFKKEYFAIVCGTPKNVSGTLTDLLFYDRRQGKSFITDKKRSGVKEASLDYQTLAAQNGFSLLKISLHTGRTHQIRVQFAHRGTPLAGDRRYGAPKESAKSVALVAEKLRFPHPITKKVTEFVAEVPKDAPWSLFDKHLIF